MKFFNQKEEVIDVQLTQYGKRLLSKGKFKPTYYAFFDEDIIYDAKSTGIIEDQNSAQERVKDRTPRLHTQHVFEGIRTNLNQNLSVLDATYQYQSFKESEQILGLPLAESSLSGNLAPAWNVRFYHNELSSSNTHITSSGGTLRVPQLNSEVKYETFISFDHEDLEEKQQQYWNGYFPSLDETLGASDGNIDEYDEPGAVFDDNSVIIIKRDALFLDVKEKNIDYLRKNFDVEVFITDIEGGEEKSTKKLYFHNGSLDTPVTQDNVQYWLAITVDGNIPEDTYCYSNVPATKKETLGDPVYGCLDNVDEDFKLRNFYSQYEEDDDPC